MEETNSTPEVPVQPTPQPPKKNMNKWLAIAIVLIVFVAAGAYWLKSKNVNQPTNSTTDNGIPSTKPLISGLVNWIAPVKVKNIDIIDQSNPENKDIASGATFYKVGTFAQGVYASKNLYVGIMAGCYGPCPDKVIRFVDNTLGDPSKKYAILKNNSDPLDDLSGILDASKFSLDSSTTVSDLEMPDKLTGPQGQALSLVPPQGFQGHYNIFNETNLKLVFTDPKLGKVYTTPDDPSKVETLFAWNGFYVQAPDWNTWVYTIDPGFVKDGIPQITWANDGHNDKSYGYQERTGCGVSSYASVVHNLSVANDLNATGTTSTGAKVYELKDSNSPILKDLYNNRYQTYDGSAKIPYDQFVAAHPIFYWVDSFGRLIQFTNNDFQPQAECGKPVIYLYPTQTEKVDVKVEPTGGFSYTEPTYLNGWEVTAEPSGKLTTADGKIYPYLFWEGRSKDIYQTPERGFVVAQKDLHQFLTGKLAELGLNAQETADFEEYWEPYMKEKPYYFVTFMGNSVMDRIAPLSVTPAPDTIIRVLMDYKGLDQPIPVQGYQIATPARRGFTVIEWGGVKH